VLVEIALAENALAESSGEQGEVREYANLSG
jgi:hypothetical protein